MNIEVVALWRFPFKSMLGERVDSLRLSERGADCDRLFALQEMATHKLATARQYPQLLEYHARVRDGNNRADTRVDVEIVRPDGGIMSAEDDAAVSKHFSEQFGKKVQVAHAFDERNPKGLFDDAQILIASLQSLATFEAMQPESRFDQRRFRANIWLNIEDERGFPEESWVGKNIRIGNEVELAVEKVCTRCVMTTLPQEDLQRDNEVLKTIVQKNEGGLGVYAAIVSGGTIRVGDKVHVK